MSIVTTLLGGMGLFLLGMALMTEGLKLAAGDALRAILGSWTRTPLRGFGAGVLITGVVQSSSAVTVATVGFVNAGLLTLSQAIWVIFGANVGTTMTGWLVALVGLKVDVGAMALPFIGIGMLMRLFGGGRARFEGLGQAIAGFGAFFLGVDVLRDGFETLAPAMLDLTLAGGGITTLLAFVGIGAAITVLTQSSSVAIAIALTANAGGGLPLELAAAVAVGTNIGTTSSALFAAMGATAAARRVAAAHIVFNLAAGAAALLMLRPLLWLSVELAGLAGSGETVTLAMFHTLFNVMGVLLIWPLAGALTRRLSGMFVSRDEELGQPRHLDPTLAEVPQLALRGLALETARMRDIGFGLALARLSGAGAPARDRAEQAGMERLGAAIGAFIERLGQSAMPQETAHGLPDILRAVTHLEDMAVETEGQGAAFASLNAHEGGRRLISAARAAFTPADEGAALDAAGDEVETAYQALKGELLHAAAEGRIGVEVMEGRLRAGRRLRRAAEAAVKTGRRLRPWLAGA